MNYSVLDWYICPMLCLANIT